MIAAGFLLALAMIFGCSDGGLTDKRDGKTYKSVKIWEQIWMAENLNYEADGSKCYDNKTENCEKYGRLYDWATAMALPDSCNISVCDSLVNANHQGICPSGWHIPSDVEWSELISYIEDTCDSIRYDRPRAGVVRSWDGSRQNTCGFAGLPGGRGASDGGFYGVDYYAYWLSATENDAFEAYGRIMYNNNMFNYDVRINFKDNMLSVRCVRD